MYVLVSPDGKKGLSINGKMTSVVNDMLVFHKKINAARHYFSLINLVDRGLLANDLQIVEVMIPEDFMNFKYFGD